MSQDDVPWLRSDAKGDIEPLNKMESGTETQERPKEREGKAKIVYWTLKVITMSLCLLMAATSVVGLRKFFTYHQECSIFAELGSFSASTIFNSNQTNRPTFFHHKQSL